MPPTIQVLAEKCKLVKGRDYFYAHKALMNYVHQLSDLEFRQEITQVTNPDIFGVLWSVGLSYKRQVVVMNKRMELEK